MLPAEQHYGNHRVGRTKPPLNPGRFNRDPLLTRVHGNIALLGDAAHPPLQYIAQGAIMAIEDGWVLAEHVAASAEPAGASTGRPP